MPAVWFVFFRGVVEVVLVAFEEYFTLIEGFSEHADCHGVRRICEALSDAECREAGIRAVAVHPLGSQRFFPVDGDFQSGCVRPQQIVDHGLGAFEFE